MYSADIPIWRWEMVGDCDIIKEDRRTGPVFHLDISWGQFSPQKWQFPPRRRRPENFFNFSSRLQAYERNRTGTVRSDFCLQISVVLYRTNFKMLRVKHLCSLYSIYVMWNAVTNGELTVWILTNIGPRTWIFVVVLSVYYSEELFFNIMYLVKMCKILLIFVAKFQKFFWGHSPQTTGWRGTAPPQIASLRSPPYSFPPNISISPRTLGV